MKRHIQSFRVIFVALLLSCGVALKAQTITASVNGIVTDPTGAVIVNAKVTATNIDTDIATTTTTNNDGVYNIRFSADRQLQANHRSAGLCDGNIWTVCPGNRPDRKGRRKDGTVEFAAEGIR